MENKTNNKLTFFGKIPGISVEQLIRYGKFDMKVKHFHNHMKYFISLKVNANSFLIIKAIMLLLVILQ